MKTYREFINEAQLNEKAYRMTGSLGTKTPIGGKVLQAFKKKVEKLKRSDSTDKDIQSAWNAFAPEGAKIVKAEVEKAAGAISGSIAGISAKLGKAATWEDEGLNVSIANDFVIEIAMNVDTDDKKMSSMAKKLKGSRQGIDNHLTTSKSHFVTGNLKSFSGSSVIEIRDTFLLQVDEK